MVVEVIIDNKMVINFKMINSKRESYVICIVKEQEEEWSYLKRNIFSIQCASYCDWTQSKMHTVLLPIKTKK